jgi:branched-chain amino acid transport system ATP-binding protein
MAALLQVEGIELAYGDVAACRGISFTVNEGEIVTLVGSNGAGKSTTLRGVAGAMRPRRGRILFRGNDVVRVCAPPSASWPASRWCPRAARCSRSSRCARTSRWAVSATAATRPAFNGLIERMMEAHFPRLRERSAQRAGTLSGGEQQMPGLVPRADVGTGAAVQWMRPRSAWRPSSCRRSSAAYATSISNT